MRRKAGLYSEIILTIALVVGAALIFGGFLLLRLTERELLGLKVESSRQLVEFVASSASLPLSAQKPEVAYQLVEKMLANSGKDLESWQITDPGFKQVAGTPKNGKGGANGDLAMLHEVSLFSLPVFRVDYQQSWLPFVPNDHGVVTVAAPLTGSGVKYGVLQAKYSLDSVSQQVVSARNLVFIYIFLYGSILVAFGAIVLGRNVVTPVRRLREATSRVSSGDLTASVPVAGPGEIADLATSFNAMTEALEKGREELLRSERMVSVGHLSAGMAHEIGNPLGAVVGYLELLKSELEPGRSREMVEHSLSEVARIDRLVKDLLDYAAPSMTSAEVIEPAKVLHEAIEILRYQAAFDAIQIEIDCPGQLARVRIDPHKLMQVLVNLLLNAKDCSDELKPLRVKGYQSDEYVMISVQDEGCGMPEDTLQNIFDPFFTTKPQGKGRGLGLTVCHRIITEAGGKIDVTTEQGVGTTFVVRLPIERGGSA